MLDQPGGALGEEPECLEACDRLGDLISLALIENLLLTDVWYGGVPIPNEVVDLFRIGRKWLYARSVTYESAAISIESEGYGPVILPNIFHVFY